MNQELILDYCFYLKKRLFISDGSFIMPAPTEILPLKCCICKNRIFLSDRRRNVCINYFIPPAKNVFWNIRESSCPSVLLFVRPSVYGNSWTVHIFYAGTLEVFTSQKQCYDLRVTCVMILTKISYLSHF